MMRKASIGRGAFAPSLDEQAALVIGPAQKAQLERLTGFVFERHPVMDEFDESDTRNHFSDERLRCLIDYVVFRAKALLDLPTVDPEKILRDIG